jgi:ATP-dependent Lon protease
MTIQEQSHRGDAGSEPVRARPAQSADESSRSAESTLPEDVLSIVPVRDVVLFPGMVMPLSLGRPKSIAAAQEAARSQRPIGVLLQRKPEADDPTPDQLYEVGCVAGILRYVTAPDGNHHIVCQGQQRFRVREFVPGYPFIAARVERIDEPEERTPEVEARFFHLKDRALEALQLLPQVPPELINAVQSANSTSQTADLVASFMDLRPPGWTRSWSCSNTASRCSRSRATSGSRPRTRSRAASASTSCASR